ncbi:MAG TPA: CDGSH iron-sulfur domain-containing protein [Acidobacteriota bacterium]|nr:CDGSH iron-sulfur domain-containing protein [Acidobacteriota bacterium]
MNGPKQAPRIKVTKDGPVTVYGGVPLARENIVADGDGEPEKWEKGPAYPDRDTYALCRCGASKDKPFCDGSHIEAGFDGTETANREGFLERAERTSGPELDLTWSAEICAATCFCHRGEEAWGYAKRSDDPAARAAAVEEACNCPSGSLVAWDKKTGAAIEPVLEPSIGLVEDPTSGTSGPIRVKGGIPVESAEGVEYETRNRATLCRCGKSGNKPFCDGTHVLTGFKSSV